jgi:hypothetical protein
MTAQRRKIVSEPDKSLKDKAVKIKGKDYVQVADRILYFNETYPKGSIQTKLVSDPTAEVVIIKATVFPEDSGRQFNGYSQARWGDGAVNKTAALENAETSAVGRALAMMGIGVIESVASSDEMNKSTSYPQTAGNFTHPPTENQMTAIKGYLVQLGVEEEKREEIIKQVTTFQKASTLVSELKEKMAKKRAEEN